MTGPVVDLGTATGAVVALLPELLLTAWALVVTLFVAWRHAGDESQRAAGGLALGGLVATLILVIWYWVSGVRAGDTPAMVALDPFHYATSCLFLLGGLLVVLLSPEYLSRERIAVPEYYLLVLLATVGMMFMGGGADLIVIFLGLELMSVCVYVLTGINRRSALAAEAAFKYFLLGAFASGFFLYGIALIYGATGSTNLAVIGVRVATGSVTSSIMLRVGTGLLIIGLGFKVAAVPFHMWAPDVYDGAPTPITAYMAAAVKAAGFAAVVRVLVQALGGVALGHEVLWWLAAITMVIGNLLALAQRQLKRLLAYSSVGHAGYLLAAVATGTARGVPALLYYIFAYTLMTVGAFAVVGAAGRGGERDVRVDDLSGLAQRRPWLAFAMAVFMLSLLGFPGTAGFIGKWYILSAAVDGGQITLAVILVGASVVSAGYYLPVIMAMYMKPPASEGAHADTRATGGVRLVIGAAAVLVLLFGLWPSYAMDVARRGGEDVSPPATLTLIQ